MTPDPLVSVIVPVYNGERFLGECLTSIVNQTYANLEIIVVDDGSTDGTAAVGAGVPGIRYLRQDKGGVCRARNRGMAVAGGELFAFQDADDIWVERKVEKQVRLLGEHPEFGYVLCHQRHFLERGEPLPPFFKSQALDRDEPAYVPGALLARRDVFDCIGGWDEEFPIAQDIEWLARAKDAGVPWGMVEEVLLRKRVHGGQGIRHVQRGRQEILTAVRASVHRMRAQAPGGYTR